MKNSRVTGLMMRVTVVVTMIVLMTGSAGAATVYWNVASGDWDTDANWTGGTPTSSDDVYIRNDGTATITTAATCNNLNLGRSGNGDGSCILAPVGSLNVGAIEYIGGWSGNTNLNIGYFTQNGGANTTPTLLLGNGTTEGQYALNGGMLSCSSYESIGYSYTGTLIQSSGINVSPSIYIGHNLSGIGVYNLDGGEMRLSAGLYAGFYGTGIVNQTSGIITNSGAITVGRYAGSTGTYNLSNGQIIAKGLYLGSEGAGSFYQSGGTNRSSGDILIGSSSGGVGYYEMSGGELYVTVNNYGLFVGFTAGATGTFVQVGGTVYVTQSPLQIGKTGSSSTYKLGGSGRLELAKSEVIFSDGTFIQTGGVNNVGGTLQISSNGVFRGWGVVKTADNNRLFNNGIIIADGYGDVDRTLFITNYDYVYHASANGSEGTNGYYAVNHGKLILTPVSTTNAAPYWKHPYWGVLSGYKDLVNSFDMKVNSKTNDGRFFGSLYATNHTAVPLFDPSSKIIGIWGIENDPNQPLGVTSADLTFRYDHVAAASQGIAESDLKVYYNLGGATDSWTQVTSYGVDTVNNKITASNVTDVIAFFAVGDGIVDPLPPAGGVITIK